MRYVNDGETVYLPMREGGFAKYVVGCAAGDSARIESVETGHSRWVRVEDLISEKTVAEDAARRLDGTPEVEL